MLFSRPACSAQVLPKSYHDHPVAPLAYSCPAYCWHGPVVLLSGIRQEEPCIGLPSGAAGEACLRIWQAAFPHADVALNKVLPWLHSRVAPHQVPNRPNSSWVLGWQFTAGEHIQQQRDVFGDDGIYDVVLEPDAAAAAAAVTPQGIAVLSKWRPCCRSMFCCSLVVSFAAASLCIAAASLHLTVGLSITGGVLCCC